MPDDYEPCYWRSVRSFADDNHRRGGGRKVWVEVVPLTFGRARITITDGWSVFDGW